MSEFSNSLHLVSDDQQDGVDLLRRAGKDGWVFPPGNGWVTVVIDDEGTIPAPPSIVAANSGLLLDYLNAEDHAWMFRLFRGPAQLQAYECAWEGVVEADTAALNVDDLVETLGVATGRTLDADLIRSLLYVETMDDVMPSFPGGNPGHRFASAIGLEYFEWLSGDYMSRPDPPTAPDTVRVERD